MSSFSKFDFENQLYTQGPFEIASKMLKSNFEKLKVEFSA